MTISNFSISQIQRKTTRSGTIFRNRRQTKKLLRKTMKSVLLQFRRMKTILTPIKNQTVNGECTPVTNLARWVKTFLSQDLQRMKDQYAQMKKNLTTGCYVCIQKKHARNTPGWTRSVSMKPLKFALILWLLSTLCWSHAVCKPCLMLLCCFLSRSHSNLQNLTWCLIWTWLKSMSPILTSQWNRTARWWCKNVWVRCLQS